jgi:hypothetical protein
VQNIGYELAQLINDNKPYPAETSPRKFYQYPPAARAYFLMLGNAPNSEQGNIAVIPIRHAEFVVFTTSSPWMGSCVEVWVVFHNLSIVKGYR